MNFSFFKNISPIYFYLVSVVCFVLSNVVRDKNIPLYYILLFLGAIFFILGFFKRMKNR
ncbi:hypothetical protein SAMN05443549_10417 [Flavobacterium fluvii]|uniref:Uncharacterized protein n=1 Tax=Flavobacterium fluvii TaxID=468056 RepID=A0A1M5JP46_9FLAO|nr:hypothetical protein SAMN05443549_10417 [Flavobacterium fluvii]